MRNESLSLADYPGDVVHISLRRHLAGLGLTPALGHSVRIMRNSKHPLDAPERLDPEWERAVQERISRLAGRNGRALRAGR